MVMHARKLPRINDGFSEKHQTHGYENSKYSSKQYRYTNHEKSRDSPSTNSLRSTSPDSRSQSPRYHKSSYYKVREKERERENRERERERDYKEYRERDNSRSPKERRREVRERERDREHRESRGLHERSNSVHKKEERDRLLRVGDWSEHVSSSGKKYYYNCRTEVSQWEKPPEWIEWERSHSRGSSVSALAAGVNHLCNKESSLSLSLHRSHHEKSRQAERHSTVNDGYSQMRDYDRERRGEYRNDGHFDHRRDSRKYNQDIGSADMDISSGDSTPTSEPVLQHPPKVGNEKDHYHHHHSTSTSHLNFAKPILSQQKASSSISLPTGFVGHSSTASLASSSLTGSSNNCVSGMASSGSSHVIFTNSIGSTNIMSNAGAHTSVPQLLNSHPRLSSISNPSSSSSFSENNKIGHNMSHYSAGHSSANNEASISVGSSMLPNKHHLEPLSLASNSSNNTVTPGPPTPTYSESQDGLDIRKLGSPNSSLNSLQSLSQNSTNMFSLTPSLGNYYKETLISHVQSWPAEGLEKQCHRLSEEAHTVGSLIMTKVSADLKMARSLVRLAEIQATLHEQRILFLRAQKSELEEIKSKDCFMNES